MWEMLLFQVVVSAEGRSCGIYITGHVHTGTKTRSCALRYIWERENLHPIVNQRPFICAGNPQRRSMSFRQGKPKGSASWEQSSKCGICPWKKPRWNSLVPPPTWTGLFSRNVSKNPWITKSPSHTEQRLFIFQRDGRHNWRKSAC